MRLTALISIFLFAIAGTAAAGGHEATAVVEHIFEMADQDQDGALTPGEYEEADLSRFGLSFDDSDMNGDGETTLDEYLELYRVHHPAEDHEDA